MNRALITGVNGFVGSHLAEHLLEQGWRVAGTVRGFRSDVSNLAHVTKCYDGGTLEIVRDFDLTDERSVGRALCGFLPTHIFHLAAQSYVPASWNAPRATFESNAVGTLNLLEAVRHCAPGARVQVAGSSEEYGRVEMHETPITEDQPLRPLSPYGVSKVASDLLARQYAASYGLHVVVTRAFNHTGPRRGKVFAESDWARRIAQIELGLADEAVVEHGNLDAIRDLTHVADVVRGYVLALERGTPGRVYNLCSGRAQAPTMREVLDLLLAGSTTRGIETRPMLARMRPSDVEILIGDNTRARVELGWTPERKLAEIMSDLLQYWRASLHATGPAKIAVPQGAL